MENYLEAWNKATGNLQWGVQRAFVDVLTLASEGKTTLVYNADYADKGACLVNQAANMLVTSGGHGIPMTHYRDVVSAFDSVNSELFNKGINTEGGKVSPLAAEILLRHFGSLQEIPEDQVDAEAFINDMEPEQYIEKTDEELSADLMKMFSTEAPLDITNLPHADDVLEETKHIINKTPPF